MAGGRAVDDVAFDAIVLAGGSSTRMGTDKLMAEVGTGTLLDYALAAVADAQSVVVVGPRRPVSTAAENLHWTTEQPPGSGPASAIVQALPMVTATIVVVLAADVPFAATAIPRLVTAIGEHDAAMLIDESGRRQLLVAAYATQRLIDQTAGKCWADASVRSLVEGLDVVEVAAREAEALDCDTPDDLARARATAAGAASPAAANPEAAAR
jgi:molybdopterin-guanine dinucleotide biosynthesis protein A